MIVKLTEECFDHEDSPVKELIINMDNWYLHRGEHMLLVNQHSPEDTYCLTEFGFRYLHNKLFMETGWK